ncbi:MAG: hypothetical protein J7M26_07300 [Armatimonadetes bacterium]|nr:hypothetical protein [Armatimonadota bacterium]
MRTRIVAVAVALLGLFGLLAGVQAYWQVVAADALCHSPYDQRVKLRRRLAVPGHLQDADGEPLLRPVPVNSGWTYRYTHPEAFCHLTGYNERTGLRAKLESALLGEGRWADWHDRFANPRPRGCDVELTIPAELQEAAVNALGAHAGCALVLRLADGATLAAVSRPGFDPVAVGADPAQREIAETDPDEPLVFKPLQKLYRPGWAMAWVTAGAALASGDAHAAEGLLCEGAARFGRKLYHCSDVHGRLTLEQALRRRCKIAVQKAAERVGAEKYRSFVKKVHLLDQANFFLPSEAGKLPDLFNWRARENLAETAIGDGAVRLTPLQVARYFLAVGQGGEVVQPYLVAQVMRPGGKPALVGEGKSLGRGMSSQVAETLGGWLADTAEGLFADGLGQPPGAGVAWWVPRGGHHPDGQAWFVALDPWPQPRYLVLVLVERAQGEQEAVEAGQRLLNYVR